MFQRKVWEIIKQLKLMLGLFLTSCLMEVRKISQEDFLVPRQTWVETWRTGPLARRGLERQDNLKVCAKVLGQWGFPETERSLEHWQTGEVQGQMRCKGSTGRHSGLRWRFGLTPSTMGSPWEACVPETPHIKRAIFKIPHSGEASVKKGSGKGKQK